MGFDIEEVGSLLIDAVGGLAIGEGRHNTLVDSVTYTYTASRCMHVNDIH